MKILLALSLILLTTGCAADPWSLAAIVTDTLVQLENTCEDPKVDAATYTFTEAITDVFLMPVNLVMVAGRLGATFTAVPIMSVMGYQQETILSHIDWVFPLHHAGPDPEKVRYHDHMIDPQIPTLPCEKDATSQEWVMKGKTTVADGPNGRPD